ncbi:MAG: hypothetical protein IJJ19_04500 [Erysipelotrichaceae bacterium]|nr:hypothetical protein [Erysipelotrichaceae bacterium]MBR0474243.1 hypothetical protein [Erysipelotrichaceae bacterium]
MNKLEQKYNADRSWLLVITIFTLINIVFIVSETDRSFYFSAFVPMIASALSHYFFEGTLKLLTVVLFCGLVVVIFLISYLFSKKNYFWILISAVLYTVDLLAMIVFIASMQYQNYWTLDIILHVIALFFLYRGFFVGKKLYSHEDKYNTVQNLKKSRDVEYLVKE